MFVQYKKLKLTKGIKDFKKTDNILISQEMIDYATAYMILNKKIRKIINCVDQIYRSSGLCLLIDSGIDIIFMPKLYFEDFEDEGEVKIYKGYMFYKNILYKECVPEFKDIKCLYNDFLRNTVHYMSREKELLNNIKLSGKVLNLSERVIIFSRCRYTREDLLIAKNIIKSYNPTIIAVDGGADIALKHGIKPDVIVGDMDSVSLKAIEKCDNFLLHCYLSGLCPSDDKIPELKNKGYISCIGTSEDAALLYCIKQKVMHIYTIGFHTSVEEFIEKGRSGASSYLLIRILYSHLITDIKNSFVNRDYVKFSYVWIAFIIALYLGFLFTITAGVFK
ncbi:hypothetical protein Q428_13275 [Fervidicella metallireducens AeB]|uniref:Thiamin pyrophosphokinase catalytic domain-containing protein n=1 Tax=Fervidicella metallireducens AeB TaxID=1403537 RepID=A0A017RSJ6_9CLOT|nr:putative cytokinetic ring protein SteA [Fervidicella metallireducens]EYE87439.1 hypothetical protein Q428_13275 [Fervidicella metallireducens AeB]